MSTRTQHVPCVGTGMRSDGRSHILGHEISRGRETLDTNGAWSWSDGPLLLARHKGRTVTGGSYGPDDLLNPRLPSRLLAPGCERKADSHRHLQIQWPTDGSGAMLVHM